MRRLARAVLAALPVVLLLPGGAPAQEEGAVRLTLVKQTPWSSPQDPTIDLSVRAENSGTAALDRLSLVVEVFSAVHSRTQYEASLQADGILLAVPLRVFPQDGTIQAGAAREFSVTVDLSPLALATASFVYPMKVELRSAGVAVAAMHTPTIFVVEKPKAPLTLGWTFVLSEPILFGPDGRFRAAGLESAIGPGGRLASEASAIANMAAGKDASPFDLVVSPTLVSQLVQMRDGYTVAAAGAAPRVVEAGQGGAAAAGQVLDELRKLTGSGEISAFPLAAPNVSALLASGLGKDLTTQIERGRDVVSQIGGPVDPGVFRAPGGALDQASLDALAGQGVSTVLLDAGSVSVPPQLLGFAAPATFLVASAQAATGSLAAVVPDAGVQNLLASPLLQEDPVLGAQAVIGELATIWLERPSEPRGAAVLLPEGGGPPGAFYPPFVRGIAGAPWLDPVTATTLIGRFPPAGQPLQLLPRTGGAFSRNYVDHLKGARRRIGAYRSILVQPNLSPNPDPGRLETWLLLAEGGQFVSAERGGSAFVQAARDAVGGAFAGIGADEGQEFTLISRRGPIPLRMHNDTGQPVSVVVTIQSSRLAATPPTQIRLDPGNTTLPVDLNPQTTGHFTVTVLISSPSGRPVSQTDLVVRSTAYSRVALIITIVAFVLLLAAWIRRSVPRKSR